MVVTFAGKEGRFFAAPAMETTYDVPTLSHRLYPGRSGSSASCDTYLSLGMLTPDFVWLGGG